MGKRKQRAAAAVSRFEDSDDEMDVTRDETHNEDDEGEETVEIRFTTDLPQEHRVPATAVRVPSNVTRLGLSSAVNMLLGRTGKTKEDGIPDYVPYDFVLNDTLVRSPLNKLMGRLGLSTEEVHDVRYFLAVDRPEDGPSFQHEDWVSNIASSGESLAFTSCYDGHLRLFCVEKGAVDKPLIDQQVSSKPLRCIAVASHIEGMNEKYLSAITGGHDRRLQALTVNVDEKQPTVRSVFTVDDAHESSVESLCISKDRLCSGAWDGLIKLWSVQRVIKKHADGDGSRGKKRKVHAEQVEVQLTVESDLRGHTQACSSLCFLGWENEICSGGWDRTARMWDIPSRVCLSVISLPDVVRSICTVNGSVDGGGKCALLGCSDRCVRLWDTRAKPSDGALIKRRFGANAHKSAITSVATHPTDQYCFATTCLDGSVRLFDLRSSVPLRTDKLRHQGKKILCGSFCGRWLLTGGEDCVLRSAPVEERR